MGLLLEMHEKVTIHKEHIICVVVKMAPIGTRTQNCFFRVRRSAGLSIPGWNTYYLVYVVQCIYLCIALTL